MKAIPLPLPLSFLPSLSLFFLSLYLIQFPLFPLSLFLLLVCFPQLLFSFHQAITTLSRLSLSESPHVSLCLFIIVFICSFFFKRSAFVYFYLLFALSLLPLFLILSHTLSLCLSFHPLSLFSKSFLPLPYSSLLTLPHLLPFSLILSLSSPPLSPIAISFSLAHSQQKEGFVILNIIFNEEGKNRLCLCCET